jgi:hypothetical protein
MFRRRRSFGDRVRSVLPIAFAVTFGIALMTGAMNLVVTVPPNPVSGPTPRATPTPPTFPPIPSYPIVTDPPEVTAFPSIVLPTTKPLILTKRLLEHDPAGIWDVAVEYPAFQSTSTPLANDMNAGIEDLIRTQADQFEIGPASIRQRAGKVNHLVAGFTVELLTPALATFTLTWTDDTAPGAVHRGVLVLNFDLATGQPFDFDTVFSDSDAALAVLSTQASDLLYYQLGARWDQTRADLNLTPTHAHFANWAVTAAGLHVIFGQYQVVSSDELPSVTVPWSALRRYVRAGTAVAVLSGAEPLATPTPTATPTLAASPPPESPTDATATPSEVTGS